MIPQMMGRFRIRRRFAGGGGENEQIEFRRDIRRRLDAVLEQVQELQTAVIRNQNAVAAAIGDGMQETLEEAKRLHGEAEEKRKHARQAEERTRHMIRRATEQAAPQPAPAPQPAATAKPLPAWVPR